MTPAFTFDPTERAVFWKSLAGDVRLSDESCEAMLDMFEREGDQPQARAAHAELYQAHMKAGGIARVCSVRRAA